MSDSRRKRSRSRSPNRSSAKSGGPVNMLDPSALAAITAKREKRPRHENSSSNPNHDRDRGYHNDRGNGRNYNGGRYEGRKSFPENKNRRGIRSRLSFSNDRRRENTEEKKNGSFRDNEHKPVQVLVDPTAVPRARAFFTHDDRGGNDDQWRGKSAYDPRIDFGPRRDRRGDTYGYRRNDHRGRNDRDWNNRDREWSNRDRDYNRDRSRNNRSQREPSKADGVWTHDLFDSAEKSVEEKKEEEGTKQEEDRDQDQDRQDAESHDSDTHDSDHDDDDGKDGNSEH